MSEGRDLGTLKRRGNGSGHYLGCSHNRNVTITLCQVRWDCQQADVMLLVIPVAASADARFGDGATRKPTAPPPCQRGHHSEGQHRRPATDAEGPEIEQQAGKVLDGHRTQHPNDSAEDIRSNSRSPCWPRFDGLRTVVPYVWGPETSGLEESKS